MDVISIRKIDSCLEGINAWDLLLNTKISEEFIFSLTEIGKLIYHSELDKPFFRLIVKGRYTAKGSLGNKTIRLILPNDASQELVDDFINKIKSK